MSNLLWFSEITSDDILEVGKKAFSLSELYNMSLPIPQGFVITTSCFKKFLEHTRINKQISSILDNLNIDNFKLLQAKVNEVKEIIMKAEFPENIKDEIFESYDNLGIDEEVWRKTNKTALDLIRTGRNLPYLAVRSSYPNDNYKKVTYLNIKGISSLITVIKKCWVNFYSLENVYYRKKNNLDNEFIFGLIVQKMINPNKSGIITLYEEYNDEIRVEAVYGMNDLLYTKTVMPNIYLINKDTLEIKEKEIGAQEFYLTIDQTGNSIRKDLEKERQGIQTLNDEEILKLAGYYKRVQEYFNRKMRIEFAVENNKLYIIKVKESI